MKKSFIVIVFFILILFSAHTVEALGFETGIFGFFNTHEDSAPSPLLHIFSGNLLVPINQRLKFDFSVSFFSVYYGYPDETQRPVPLEYENREFLVLGFLLDPSLAVFHQLNEEWEIGLTAGPAFNFWLPIRDENAPADVSLAEYFYSNLRFLYPSLGFYVSYKLTALQSVYLRFKTFFPVYNLWLEEGVPFYDHMGINIAMGFRFFL